MKSQSSQNNEMNLLVICFSHAWGGLEQVAASDAMDQASHGVSVRVLCRAGTPIHRNLQDRLRVSGSPLVQIFAVDYTPRNYFDFCFKRELDRFIAGGVNLIHIHQPSLLGSIVPWLWLHPRVALVATRHILCDHNKRDLIHHLLYRRVDYLIVMSQMLRRNVLQTHPIREAQVQVVHLGLDFEEFNPNKMDLEGRRNWRKKYFGVDDETVVVGLVGRIDPAKGQASLIKAAAGLLKGASSQRKIKFVMVGEETVQSNGKHLTELMKMVTQFGLSQHVQFIGFQENIPEIMGSLDLLVMPSLQEAFGLVAIEAMAMECPVIISKGGSADEIVGKDEFGLTVKPNDPFELKTQIRYLLDHPEERKRLGLKGREHIVQHFDRQTRIQETLSFYQAAWKSRHSHSL